MSEEDREQPPSQGRRNLLNGLVAGAVALVGWRIAPGVLEQVKNVLENPPLTPAQSQALEEFKKEMQDPKSTLIVHNLVVKTEGANLRQNPSSLSVEKGSNLIIKTLKAGEKIHMAMRVVGNDPADGSNPKRRSIWLFVPEFDTQTGKVKTGYFTWERNTTPETIPDRSSLI